MTLPRLIRDFSHRSWGSYASLGLQLARGVLLAGILAPADFGVVALVGIVTAYSIYADLGLSAAVARQLPLSIGAGDLDGARAWRWYALFFKLMAESVVAALLLGFLLLRWSSLQPELRFGLLIGALVCVIQGVLMAQQTVFEASRQFGRSAVLLTAFFGLNLLAGVLGAMVLGVRGVFLGQALAFSVAIVMGVALGGWAPRVPLEPARVSALARIGIPLAVLNFAAYNLVYIDQVMVTVLLGQSLLGVYMMVLYVGSVLWALPQAMSGVVSPLLMERFGMEGTAEAIRDYTWRPVRILSLVLPPMIMLMWIVAPALIAQFLPMYAASIAPMRIYIVGLFFYGLNFGVGSTLLALGKHLYNLPIVATCIGINVGLDLVFVRRLDWGLNGIALGSALTYCTYWMAHTYLVRRYYHEHGTTAIIGNLRSGWPGFVLAVEVVVAWKAGDLASSQPMIEALYLTPVLFMTAARLLLGRRRPAMVGAWR